MNGLDLFTGSGAFTLALRNHIPGYRTVGYVEKDPYRQALLIARIADGLLDDAPISDDIRDFDPSCYKGLVEIITGGVPCQPFSVAGQRKGKADERNLWPDAIRIIGEVGPRYSLLENVPGLLADEYAGQIYGDLAEIGYDAEWDVVSAAFVGAPHIRRRLWILAYDSSQQAQWDDKGRLLNKQKEDTANGDSQRGYLDGRSDKMADPDSQGQPDIQGSTATAKIPGDGTANRSGWWDIEPPICGMVNGMEL